MAFIQKILLLISEQSDTLKVLQYPMPAKTLERGNEPVGHRGNPKSVSAVYPPKAEASS
jgi:hypothetical protein